LRPLLLSHFTATSAIGRGLDASLDALRRQASGLMPCPAGLADLQTYIGMVAGVDQQRLPSALHAYDSRNNRLALLGLQQDGFSEAVKQAAARLGPARVGVFLGTSTSGILETERAYRQRDPHSGALPGGFNYQGSHSNFAVADFVRRYFGLGGPAQVVSTACSSSAKVFGAARRMIEAGWIDAAVVGGVDSLCLTALYGFNSLELLSSRPCSPYDSQRDGISIGEAAAFMLIERLPDSLDAGAIVLSGFGESSDAYHMSSPHPEGRGASQAMSAALASAGLPADAIDYINLHGTATPSNDRAEGRAVEGLFGAGTPCSSTKGASGHTLGAAGGLEAVICALALRHGLMPGGAQRSWPQAGDGPPDAAAAPMARNERITDPDIQLNYLLDNIQHPLQHVLSNSFGFGGSNCCLILSRAN